MTSGVPFRSGSSRESAPRPGIFRVLRVSRLVDRVRRGSGAARRRVLDSGNERWILGGVLRLGGAGWRAIGGAWRRIGPWRASAPITLPSTSSSSSSMAADIITNESNILTLDSEAKKDLDVERILERSCLPGGIFAFSKVCKEVGQGGLLRLEAWSRGADEDGNLEWCEGCLSMSEIGRQLGMLGVVAVSEIDPESTPHFCLADTALVDEYGVVMDPRIPLRGVARLHSVNPSQAKAQMEMWQEDRLLCRLSIAYKITNSWEDVLPNSQVSP